MRLFPAVRQDGAGETWRLVHDWTVCGVSVPKGTCFKPSVPRVVWPIVSPVETLAASAVHDYMYRYQISTRRRADRIFLLVMRRQGQSWWRRRLAYGAVRALGWAWW